MAGVNYEVNIKLNTTQLNNEFNVLEQRVDTLKKNLTGTVRSDAQATRRTLRMATESVDALVNAQRKRYSLDQKIRRLEEAGVRTDKLREELGRATTAQSQRQFGTFKQITRELDLSIQKEKDRLGVQQRQTRELERQARIGGPRNPIGGAANIPGSPAALSAQRQRRSGRLQGVALGAGFPLLFGGGPGAVLGGAAGGLVGGPAGFAAQIALSAVGQQFDKLGGQAIKLGLALRPITFDVQTVSGALGYAGTKTEEFLAKIEEFGGKAAAAAEASKLLASRIGKDAADALTKFGEDAQKVGNQISIIFTKVLAAIAAAAGPLLASLGAGLTRINQIGGFRERTGLTGADLTAQQFLTRGTGRLSRAQRQKFATGLGLGAGATTGEIRRAAEARAVQSQQTFETRQSTALENQAKQLEASAKAAKDASKAAEKYKKELERSRELSADLQRSFDQQVRQLTTTAGEAERRLRIELDYENRAVRIAEIKQEDLRTAREIESSKIRELELLKLETDELFRQAGLSKEITNAIGQRMDRAQAGVAGFRLDTALLDLQKQKLDDVLKKYPLIGQAAQEAGNLATFGMTQMIEGAKTVEQTFADFLRNIADLLLRSAAQMIATYTAIGIARMFAGIPATESAGDKYGAAAFGGGGPTFNPSAFSGGSLLGRANGGPVTANKPYMVGERGPELFVPGAQGNIVPTSGMGGSNIVVNVDASGSSVEGKGDEAKRLGDAIGVAVQQELIKQKRPGGLLA